MKRISRRDFLKATGITIAGAGLALLGEGCQPPPTPDDIAHPDVETPGPNYQLPACCSYESAFRVSGPPKRPFYAIWAQPLGEAIDYLNVPENTPGLDASLKMAVQNCLGFSIDMLFQGDTHSARNGLASIAEILTLYFGGYLASYLPEGVSPVDARDSRFYDPAHDIDLWDTIYFPASASEIPVETGSNAVSSFISGKDDPLSRWLHQLQKIADSFQLRTVFGEELAVLTKENEALLLGFFGDARINKPGIIDMPEYPPDAVIAADAIQAIGYSNITSGMNYEQAMRTLSEDFIMNTSVILILINGDDSIACEKALADSYALNGIIKTLLRALMRIIEEKTANARDGVVDNAATIWEPIQQAQGNCALAGLEAFANSLGDWCGAKKYIMAAACALLQVPTILIAINVPWVAPFAIKVAIAGFIYCFLKAMVWEATEELAEAVTTCLVTSVFN